MRQDTRIGKSQSKTQNNPDTDTQTQKSNRTENETQKSILYVVTSSKVLKGLNK